MKNVQITAYWRLTVWASCMIAALAASFHVYSRLGQLSLLYKKGDLVIAIMVNWVLSWILVGSLCAAFLGALAYIDKFVGSSKRKKETQASHRDVR
jgi:hypothetical protein